MLRVEARTRLGELALALELDVRAGECVALAGPSGAGKTSLLRVVSGLVRPEQGRVDRGGEIWLDTERGTAAVTERSAADVLTAGAQ